MGWQQAAGKTREEKEENVCRGCHLFETKPRDPDDVENTEEIQDLVDEIELLISLADAGIRIDFDSKEFFYFYLFRIWRGLEKDIENSRQCRLQAFLKAWEKTD